MLDLHVAAGALMGAANRLSIGASSAGKLTDEVVISAQLDMTAGALAIRNMGSMFRSDSEALFAAANSLDPARPTTVNNAIKESLSGAAALLTRATHR